MSNPLFKKIAGAKASSGGTHITDGKYRFAVEKMMVEKKEGGNFFIAELHVLESESTVEGVTANKPGTSASYVLNLDTNKSAMGNVKALILGLLGVTEEEAGDDLGEAVEEMCGKDQPARGTEVLDQTFRKPIKSGPNAGKPFTGHKWTHVEQTEDEVKARRKYLDDKENQGKVAA